MPRPLLTLALLLSFGTAAQACPVKAGYVANGMFKGTFGLTPLCAPAFKKITAAVKSGEYVELYRTTLNAAGAAHVLSVINRFRAQGWTLTKTANNKGATGYLLTKNGRQTVVSVREESAYVLVAVLGDR